MSLPWVKVPFFINVFSVLSRSCALASSSLKFELLVIDLRHLDHMASNNVPSCVNITIAPFSIYMSFIHGIIDAKAALPHLRKLIRDGIVVVAAEYARNHIRTVLLKRQLSYSDSFLSAMYRL